MARGLESKKEKKGKIWDWHQGTKSGLVLNCDGLNNDATVMYYIKFAFLWRNAIPNTIYHEVIVCRLVKPLVLKRCACI